MVILTGRKMNKKGIRIFRQNYYKLYLVDESKQKNYIFINYII